MQIENFLFLSQYSNDLTTKEQVEKLYSQQAQDLFIQNQEEENVLVLNDERATVIIGSENDDMLNIVSSQLSNLKENYYTVNSVNELSQIHINNTDIFIVADQDIAIKDVEYLSQVAENKILVFMNALNFEALNNANIQEIVGIRNYIATDNFTGYRISQDLGFNSMQEQLEIRFTADEVELVPSVKKYAYALSEDETIKNEDLPPLAWMYVNGDELVYVYNADIFTSPLAYSFITEIYSQLSEVFIYPIINANLFIVDGMPYAENFSSDYLSRRYSRDALNMQNSVLFPQFNSSQERYNLRITWYTKEFEELFLSEDININYYLDQITLKQGEIAKNEDGILFTQRVVNSVLVDWNEDFFFINAGDEAVNIPIMLKEGEHEEEMIEISAMAKSTGIISMYSNVDDYLYDTDKSWVDYGLEYESTLNYQENEFYWIDKVTASEAANRISTYLSINPIYSHTVDTSQIYIENFIDQAFFLMQTQKEIKEVEGASYEEVGHNLYLIRAEEQTVKIFYEDLI